MNQRWGEDPKLVALLGEQGAAGFRALFDGFPELVGVLWARRRPDGQIEDFEFGYGNPSIMRSFRIPPETRDRYTLLEALPPMRDSRAFDAYVRTCDDGIPWVNEVTYDTPFGDGYMLGTFSHRTAKLGDGVMVFLTDITEQRRMEADLRGYADVVASRFPTWRCWCACSNAAPRTRRAPTCWRCCATASGGHRS